MTSPDPRRSNAADLIEFAINLKRNSYQLLTFVELTYGIFLSYFLLMMGRTISYIAREGGITPTQQVKLTAMALMFIFVVEDFHGLKLITSICGYHLSSFRFLIDIVIGMLLFTATWLVVGEKTSDPPNAFFLLALSAVFLCGAGWSALLTKNREIPTNYSWAVAFSHMFAAAIWFGLWFMVWIHVLALRTRLFSGVLLMAFAAYYIATAALLRPLRNRGIPVDDFIEMFAVKLIRQCITFPKTVVSFVRSGMGEARWAWEWQRPKPSPGAPHYVIVAQHPDGTTEELQVTDFVNSFVGPATNCVVVAEEGQTIDPDGAKLSVSVSPSRNTGVQYFVKQIVARTAPKG